jgi:DNA polymerase I-like protein with 3'-5' exonuclease and polymerase domains
MLVHDEIVTEIPKELVSFYSKFIPKTMTDFTLTTASGAVKLLTEGNIASSWEK